MSKTDVCNSIKIMLIRASTDIGNRFELVIVQEVL